MCLLSGKCVNEYGHGVFYQEYFTTNPFLVHFGSILGPFWVHFGSTDPWWNYSRYKKRLANKFTLSKGSKIRSNASLIIRWNSSSHFYIGWWCSITWWSWYQMDFYLMDFYLMDFYLMDFCRNWPNSVSGKFYLNKNASRSKILCLFGWTDCNTLTVAFNAFNSLKNLRNRHKNFRKKLKNRIFSGSFGVKISS